MVLDSEDEFEPDIVFRCSSSLSEGGTVTPRSNKNARDDIWQNPFDVDLNSLISQSSCFLPPPSQVTRPSPAMPRTPRGTQKGVTAMSRIPKDTWKGVTAMPRTSKDTPKAVTDRRRSQCGRKPLHRSDVRNESCPVVRRPQLHLDNAKGLSQEIRALKEIRYFQRHTHLLLDRSRFQRLVKEIIEAQIPSGRQYRIQTGALRALQQAVEDYATELFDIANLATSHAKRVTLFSQDVKLVLFMNENLRQ